MSSNTHNVLKPHSSPAKNRVMLNNSFENNRSSSFTMDDTPSKSHNPKRDYINSNPIQVMNNDAIPRILPPSHLLMEDVIDPDLELQNKLVESSPITSKIQPSKSIYRHELLNNKNVYSNLDEMVKANEVFRNIYGTSPVTESSVNSINFNASTNQVKLNSSHKSKNQFKRKKLDPEYCFSSNLTTYDGQLLLQQPLNDNELNDNFQLPNASYSNFMNDFTGTLNVPEPDEFEEEPQAPLDLERQKLMDYYVQQPHQKLITKTEIKNNFVEHIVVLKVPKSFLKTISTDFNFDFKVPYSKPELNDLDDVPLSQLYNGGPQTYQIQPNFNNNSSNHDLKKLYLSPQKSGCWTCRVRHKKCTNERPKCNDCLKFDLDCDISEERPEYMINPILQKRMVKKIRQMTDLYKAQHRH
ncbi:UME6 [Candida pseudojiufengensis]|uniref:UME6 n=1 Tax=Candida pseudojiufengensis TaxID=497109 RepID=UPI0022244FF8|nr:UME6 [Candida pseudojiufengensis]KAI5965690.1 UME6 [Candida pseudojiufengensis]